ncbi:Unconventional myosin-Id [Geodia barretti]|uniref:Unconventional myosin-Id n=1 Tax=Geodia barretti TaxID=519541 RepID=A0AA35TWF9_GEOBA|nr:Unconventional myosin-Id [Geodia barretti]
MRYLSNVSQNVQVVDRVKNLLIRSNPVLEAFGNAQTTRNDNSSRFGKYMDIRYDHRFDAQGGHIRTYLLEKARVVHHGEGERTFHCFYQLLSGADSALLKALDLQKDPTKYHYLSMGGESCECIPNDKKLYNEVQRTMGLLNFGGQLIKSIQKLQAAILHLGNVELVDGGDGESSKVANRPTAHLVARLLGTPKEEIEKALTVRVVAAKRDVVEVKTKVDKAVYARDALAKAIYERLFVHVVKKINENVEAHLDEEETSTVISVLDIYGFEVFGVNSFEQFCINYCNEKLQQLFVELVLRREQAEYTSEGIEWIHIDYFNNEPICKMMDESPEVRKREGKKEKKQRYRQRWRNIILVVE